MNLDKRENQGSELLILIEYYADLSWEKCRHRYKSIMKNKIIATGPLSTKHPYTCFRFKSDQPKLTEELKRAVESYLGELEWVMKGHIRRDKTINWIIHPKAVDDLLETALEQDLSIEECVEKHIPGFAQPAFDDQLGLVEHIRQHLEVSMAA